MEVEDEPLTMPAVKLADDTISPAMQYFHKKHALPAIQIVKNLRQERLVGAIQFRRAQDFLNTLKMQAGDKQKPGQIDFYC